MPRWPFALRWIPVALGVAHLGLFAAVVVGRFAHPIELEWMSGGVWDHVERVMAGRPIYAEPSAEFTAYLYPPLHYWLTAAVANVASIPTAGRVVSLVATTAAGYSVYRTTKLLAGDRYSAAIAVSLFAGAYSATGFWYDLDRSDSLCVALLTSAFAVGLEAKGKRGLMVTGALLGLAFLAKQPAMVFLFAVVGALAFARHFRSAGAVLGGGLVVLLPSLVYLQSSTGGWFWFYAMKMPASHGMSASLVTLFFVVDASKTFALFGACLVAVALFVRSREKNDVLLVAFVAAAFFTSASSRMHKGGWINGLVFLTTFGSIAFGILRARAAWLKQPVLDAVLSGIVVFQLLHFFYEPGDAMPTARQVEASHELHERVARLEQDGEVLVLGHAHVGAQRHLHAMALVDVLRVTGTVPTDLATKLRARDYRAIIVDEPSGIGLEELTGKRTELFGLIARNYRVTERLPTHAAPVIGYPARPTWLLRPRETALSISDDAVAKQLELELPR